MQRTEVTPFVSRERSGRTAYRQRTKRVKAASMMTKIGLCLGICVLSLAMYLIGEQNGSQMVMTTAESTQQGNAEDPLGDVGKLHFVEMPGMLEVFAPDKGLTLPLDAPAVLEAEGCVACFRVREETQVACGGDGTVRAVGNDAAYGDYVRLSLQNGLEVIYYGLDEISVETGQPLRSGDTLGYAEEDQSLRVTVLEEGRPLQVLEYMDLTILG